MIRRDFLKAFGAFTAALAAGVKMPSGQEVALLPPPVLEQSPAVAEPLAKAMSMQEQVMACLVDCDVIGYEVIQTIAGFPRYRVTYQMDKAFGRRGVNFNEQIKPLVEGRRPVQITVHAIGRDVDICSLGSYGEKFAIPVTAPIYEIEVTWA